LQKALFWKRKQTIVILSSALLQEGLILETKTNHLHAETVLFCENTNAFHYKSGPLAKGS
jgi:hypothetical protein